MCSHPAFYPPTDVLPEQMQSADGIKQRKKLTCRIVLAGAWGYRIVWAYGTAAIGVVLVRTIKRVIFYEARQYSIDSTRHNYLLLAVWVFEFPFTWWLTAGF